MKLNYPLIIFVEGTEYVGKTTITKELEKRGIPDIENKVIYVREPGGCENAEKIRNSIFDMEDLSNETKILLFTAARVELFKKTLEPLLEDNPIIVMDRSYISTFVYQESIQYTMQVTKPIFDFIMEHNILTIFTLLLGDEELLDARRKERGSSNYFDNMDLMKIQESYKKLKTLVNSTTIYLWDYSMEMNVTDDLETNINSLTDSIYRILLENETM